MHVYKYIWYYKKSHLLTSDRLPHSVLLGTDVPEFVDLLKKDEKAVVVVTWSQACRLRWSQLEQSEKEVVEGSSDNGEVVKSVGTAASDGSEVGMKSVGTESRAKADHGGDSSSVGSALQGAIGGTVNTQADLSA